jgi:hypothetical protein
LPEEIECVAAFSVARTAFVGIFEFLDGLAAEERECAKPLRHRFGVPSPVGVLAASLDAVSAGWLRAVSAASSRPIHDPATW